MSLLVEEQLQQMVIKVYVSGISASKEVKKRQQRAMLILDSAQINYEPVDITEPGREDERMIVQKTFKSRSDKLTPLPPQFFNDDHYCGDYEDFNSAVDVDELFAFLKLEERKEPVVPATRNGVDDKDERTRAGGVEDGDVKAGTDEIPSKDINEETDDIDRNKDDDNEPFVVEAETEDRAIIETELDVEETAERLKTSDNEEDDEEEEEEEGN